MEVRRQTGISTFTQWQCRLLGLIQPLPQI
jgi:hypothetical protein